MGRPKSNSNKNDISLFCRCLVSFSAVFVSMLFFQQHVCDPPAAPFLGVLRVSPPYRGVTGSDLHAPSLGVWERRHWESGSLGAPPLGAMVGWGRAGGGLCCGCAVRAHIVAGRSSCLCGRISSPTKRQSSASTCGRPHHTTLSITSFSPAPAGVIPSVTPPAALLRARQHRQEHGSPLPPTAAKVTALVRTVIGVVSAAAALVAAVIGVVAAAAAAKASAPTAAAATSAPGPARGQFDSHTATADGSGTIRHGLQTPRTLKHSLKNHSY